VIAPSSVDQRPVALVEVKEPLELPTDGGSA
jgi:hypothetical protein